MGKTKLIQLTDNLIKYLVKTKKKEGGPLAHQLQAAIQDAEFQVVPPETEHDKLFNAIWYDILRFLSPAHDFVYKRCLKHPKYKGKMKPRVNCDACWRFYEINQAIGKKPDENLLPPMLG